jgi:putative SOS response-associated peptidase YedK
MCGRFQLALTWAQIAELYGAVADPDPGWRPSWSVCPTHEIPTLQHRAGGGRALVAARWGFPMPWLAREGRDPWGRPLINARIEEAATKRTWSGPLRRGRCAIPATGWIEWITAEGRRLPVGLAPEGGAPFALAGLTGTAERDGAPVEVAAILTAPARGAATRIHDRMPIVLVGEAIDRWIAPGSPPEVGGEGGPPLALVPLPVALNRSVAVFAPPGPAGWSLDADVDPSGAGGV